MKVFIITEGNKETGYGHLTRCLSLYQAFEEQSIEPKFLVNADEGGANYLYNINFINLNWCTEKDKFLRLITGADVAIIDSYLAPLDLYESISERVKKAVYIDDYMRIDYPKGIIINGTIGAEKLPYKKDNLHECLLGIDYIPLRKEFWDAARKDRDNGIKNVLIMFGGSDIKELTFKILSNFLVKYPHLAYYVVSGNNLNKPITPEYNKYNVKFFYSLDAAAILDLMMKCDLAISSAGQTSYELNRIGIPVILIGVIDNQKYNIEGWLENGYIHNKIWYNEVNIVDKIMRDFDIHIDIYERKLKPKGSAIVDGQGARRLVNILKK